MEKFEISSCSICLNAITDGNVRTIEETVTEQLDFLHLRVSVEENIKPVICIACSIKLLAAYKFKVTCTETEDSIFSYVNSQNVASVDLREIYIRKKGKEHLRTVLKDDIICRLCMETIAGAFTPVIEMEADIFSKYLPEANFSYTEEPVICSLCYDSLNIHCGFLKSCLNMQEDIKIISENKAMGNPFWIKSEPIEIKPEKNETNCFDVQDEIRTIYEDQVTENLFCIKSEEIEIKLEEDSTDNNVPFFNDAETLKGKTEAKSDLNSLQSELSNAQLYKCDTCDYNTKYKNNLKRHQMTHKCLSEVYTYNCDSCDYKTKFKNNLTQHHLKHEDPLKVKKHACSKCDFQTKYLKSLLYYQQKHKDPSEMYTCDVCDYKSYRKDNVINHQLIHKNLSEIQMYKCDSCAYETRHKKNLKWHELVHKDFSEVPVHQCDSCEYRTKRKFNLTQHQLKHKSFSEEQMYKCDTCDFRTKYLKSHIRHHQRHKDLP
ncbi:zinc finger protein 510-like [Anoplophora glabripennis]|uniref:zinc finger protein 510-like n=1 Tax=Anoplophora glabripennis TaxID=217634 RepID=UPI0008736DD2|nr:zinc finger protein 510-like [Anoplophora glabripennis]